MNGSALLAQGLVLARVVPLCALLVALTRGMLGWLLALSMGVAIACALAPSSETAVGLRLGATLLDPVNLGLPLALALTRELCLGVLIALALLLPLAAAGWGARFAELLSGPFGTREGPIATLHALATGFLCLSLGVHRTLLSALGQSFSWVPLGSTAAGKLGLRPFEFALGVAGLVAEVFALALAVGLPLLLSTLVVEAGFALLRRSLGASAIPLFGAAITRPLFVLLASALLMPAVVEIPGAFRIALRLLRELALRVAG